MFLFVGGDSALKLYELKSLTEVDQNSCAIISSSAISAYYGASAIVDFPSVYQYNGVAYLTYSSQVESLVSYRIYLVSAINPDYSSSASLAKSFYNQGLGPILINTNEDSGSRGLGDLSIIEGPDLSSHYAIYTSYESANVRRLNISPVSFDGANMSIAHRDERSFILNNEKHFLSDSADEIVLTSEETEEMFGVHYHIENTERVYFGYKTKNNNYSISFDDGIVSLLLMENGLESEVASLELGGHIHDVEVKFDGKLDVVVDGFNLAEDLALNRVPVGKIGYKKSAESKVGSIFFVNHNNQDKVVLAEGATYPQMYLEESSSIANENKIKVIDDERQELYGSSYLNMENNRDYARFLMDVPEDGRYGIELIYNASFGKYSSNLGLRLGLNPEVIYKTSPIGKTGYVRTLTAEFNVEKGVNELLIENLSGAVLRLVSARLVKVSNSLPSYENKLDAYAESGIRYVTDFRINTSHKAHETYEGARCFAYVGDNTITDFTYEVEVGFLGGISTSGFVGLGFRCDNFASSSLDNDESMIGYYLEISQYQTRLMKHNYGYGQTIGVADLVNTIGDFYLYKIVMKGNVLRVYKEGTLIFTFEDQFAFSSGHLAFGSNDTNGLVRKMKISPAE